MALAIALGRAWRPAVAATDGGTPRWTWYTNPDDGGQADLAEKCTEERGGDYRIEISRHSRTTADASASSWCADWPPMTARST